MNALTRDNPIQGIVLKLASITSFTIMATSLKLASTLPVGQLVFGRSFFSLIPLFAILAVRGDLRTGLQTARFPAHFGRSVLGASAMAAGFTALTLLPLPEATAIGFAGPLFVVVLSAVILKEDVRVFRWSAVLVGFGGVLIMLWPRLTLLTDPGGLQAGELIGAVAGLLSALIGAFAGITVRAMTKTERSATIVIYFALFTSLFSLVSIPFGWVWPDPREAALLVTAGIAGGFGQILLTESYRHAELSTIAPFDYTSLLYTLVVGYVLFGDLPTFAMLVGAAVVIAAGLAVIWRERLRGVDRTKMRKVSLPQN
ncbi:MAG: DMT family transporter [Hyphomicrobiaceae bacterium]|nr:DMT family transporter [Hyphomicrobiaceae bacterium]MCC0024964.1 DMT family transporter [Hyphomicrobiaceae bacterium]